MWAIFAQDHDGTWHHEITVDDRDDAAFEVETFTDQDIAALKKRICSNKSEDAQIKTYLKQLNDWN